MPPQSVLSSGGKPPAVIAKKLLVTLAGLFIMAQGVSLFLMLGIGVDPISVFLDGMSQKGGMSFGAAQTMLNVIMVALSLLFFRWNIGLSTIAALFLLGPFYDIIMFFENSFITPALSPGLKILFAIAAQLCFSLGVALYQSPEMGASPCDTPGVSISKLKGWNYGKVRIVSDGIFFICGFLLGGAAGIGTICCVLLTGPVSQLFRPHCDRLIRRIEKDPYAKS